MSRRDQLAEGLAGVRRRIDLAAARSGRGPDAVQLVVVTKTFPAEDVRLLAELGVTDVAENKHQEAVDKHAQCADLGLRWHFVGHLQSNKAGAVSAYSDVVHSIDRRKLIGGLARGARDAGRRVGCLVQVSLDPRLDPRLDGAADGPAGGATDGPTDGPTDGAVHGPRSGADPEQVLGLADRVAHEDDLDLLGVMGIAPLGGDPDTAFDLLAEVARQVQLSHPAATMVSAGMSGDLEAAIARGATHVRVGSAVLGARDVLR